jgi:tetratricopeptide (TPR) repeat protein
MCYIFDVRWTRLSPMDGNATRVEAKNMSFAPLLLIAAWIVSAALAFAQDVRTQAPCSPAFDRTQGNVTVTFSGGCNLGATPAELQDIISNVLGRRAVSLDLYDNVSRALGVTDSALTTFFRILGENKVATEDLDAKLREIAGRHLALLKQAEPSADDDPQVAAIKNQAVAAIGAGDYGRAGGLLQRAFDADLAAARRAQDVVRRVQDAADKRFLSAAKTRADIAQLSLTQLRYAAAAQDFQEAANLVPAGELLVRSGYLNSLGSAAQRSGNYPLAAPAFAEALSIRERMLDPDHPDVATSLNNLAALYNTQGRYAEAEPLYKRALAIGEKALGPDHPNVAIALNNLAVLYNTQGRYAEAEPLFKRALAIGEKALGPDHPDVATRLNNLAGLYNVQGRYADAEPLFKRALAIGEKTLGPDHPDVATRLNNLAGLYNAQGRYADAEPLFKRALAISEKALGPDHPTTKAIRNNLVQNKLGPQK